MNSFECKECRSFKVKLEDVRNMIEKMIIENYSENYAILKKEYSYESFSYDQLQIRIAKIILENLTKDLKGVPESNQQDSKLEYLIEILKNFKEYYIAKEYFTPVSAKNSTLNTELDVFFCVDECPISMPFQTLDSFCTNDKISR
jgi:hypothetical protein